MIRLLFCFWMISAMQDLEKFQLKIRRMVRIMEIEKKFLVSDIPDLSQAVKVFEIEQGYLCFGTDRADPQGK